MNSAIEVRGLCKHYRDFSLRDVSFTVPGGSIMGFIGENGAGKTTTIKSILGLLHTDGGSISVLGRDPVTDRRAIGQDIGVVLDGSFFYEGMRAKDISAVMSRLHSRWDKESFASYCKRFALPMEKPFKEFSKGMRAKLALTTALAHHPKLLVLDEATSGLDPVVRSEMLDLFLEFIQDEEHSILLSSHITSDLEKVADYHVHPRGKDRVQQNKGRYPGAVRRGEMRKSARRGPGRRAYIGPARQQIRRRAAGGQPARSGPPVPRHTDGAGHH